MMKLFSMFPQFMKMRTLWDDENAGTRIPFRFITIKEKWWHVVSPDPPTIADVARPLARRRAIANVALPAGGAATGGGGGGLAPTVMPTTLVFAHGRLDRASGIVDHEGNEQHIWTLEEPVTVDKVRDTAAYYNALVLGSHRIQDQAALHTLLQQIGDTSPYLTVDIDPAALPDIRASMDQILYATPTSELRHFFNTQSVKVPPGMQFRHIRNYVFMAPAPHAEMNEPMALIVKCLMLLSESHHMNGQVVWTNYDQSVEQWQGFNGYKKCLRCQHPIAPSETFCRPPKGCGAPVAGFSMVHRALGYT
jgi:hypothetical protein